MSSQTSAHQSSASTSQNSAILHDALDPVAAEPYFYGMLPREDAEMILLNDGEFLVRESLKLYPGASGAVLSVRWKYEVVHVIILKHDNGFMFEDSSFPTIKDLIIHCMTKHVVITKESGAVLKTPVQRAKWVLHDNQIHIIEKLGEGQFGEVWKAQLTQDDGRIEIVAVKKLKSQNIPRREEKKFFNECRRLRQLRHEHIVNFKGVSLDSCIMLVMELCDISLLAYLTKHKDTLTFSDHFKFIIQASRGMKYLASQKCIHRDLAARNCLLMGDCLKISDFGMARRGDTYQMTPTTQILPVKWIPPETLLTRNFSEKSDIWSFGVLMWEILTNGDSPYSELVERSSGSFLLELVQYLKQGNRLVPPVGVPKELKEIMSECWNADAVNRPTFNDLNHKLEKLYESTPSRLTNIISHVAEMVMDQFEKARCFR